MTYTVAEVSQLVGLSKPSIYNKINRNPFKEHTTKKQGVTYIDELGLNLIKNDIKDFKEDIKDFNTKDIDNSIDDEVATDTDDLNSNKVFINFLKTENEKLWNELNVKNVQIENLNERLKQEQKLMENNQVLLRDKPQDLFMLEEHFHELDNKLLHIKDQMEKKKSSHNEPVQKTKGFLNKLFNK
ncbi:hypothetical protein [uncultured Clostridium sp.]|uniref:hypothetical protein n=1 Tax=uncultured Clostridium sp. TaxID=59620 RepID=UPI00260B8877|nr:hypothetical protein [uncultured Clostridium sp.]